MKKDCLRRPVRYCFKVLYFTVFTLIFFTRIQAQTIATYPLATGSGNPTAGTASPAPATNANVTAGALVQGTQMVAVTYNSTGYRVKSNSLVWPVANTNGYNFDFPISPKAGFDFHLTGITASVSNQSFNTGATNLYLDVYYQIDGTGPWIRVNGETRATITSTSATVPINFGSISDAFYNGHTYVFRFYVTADAGSDKNDNFRLMSLVFNGTVTTPPAINPVVTTLTANATGKYTATATGSYSTANTKLVNQSGIVWGTSANPTVALSSYTSNGSGGIINSTLTGLTAGTLYHARAYVIIQADTIYGADQTFTTAQPTIPTVTTNNANPVLSNKATSGGAIPDSGGAAIIQKGVCWSTVQGAETATSGSNFTNDGVWATSFTSILKVLTPNTVYYAKAYAINSLGIAYGNEITFTTSAPVPTLVAIPSPLNFGTVNYGSTPPVMNYSLSGSYLSPASGSITVSAPAGYSVSLSPSSGFTSSLPVSYSGSALSATNIYVRLSTSAYGMFNGAIYHTGGGTNTQTSDSVVVTGGVIQSAQVLTNTGTDFWVGYGLEEKMSSKVGSPAVYGLQLYVAAGAQSSTIKVTMPGMPSFAPQFYTIPANSVQIVSGFPTGDANDAKNASGLPDSRLFYTGVSSRGIHVEVTNNVPVAVFLYDYATNNSAGGSMVFPTNTWNSSYIVQTYGGAKSNTGTPNTYFFVIARDDNTVVTFKPTNPILDSASSPVITGNPGGNVLYPANTTTGYQVTLNKGQVFSAIGLVDGNTEISYDLTGTNVSTTCGKQIAVFAGNARTLISANSSTCSNPSSGSDNLIQQMFPQVAWGTKYLTVPTKTMEYNLFRIGVQDPATIVTVDGTVLPQTPANWNATGLYYQIEGNKLRKIESDKPVTVTQFILPGSACGGATVGNNGTGDPEMILLSPVQQSITSTTVYTSDFKDGSSGGTYINVVIPQAGVASFRLDLATNPSQMVDTGQTSYSGSTAYANAPLIPIANAFRPHPQDPNYYWAKFHVSYPATHTLSSSVGFNAIAYGVANGESWGYNAGTTINDLTAITTTQTPYGTSNSATTCKSNPTTINLSLPYPPSQVTSMKWSVGNNPKVSPNTDTTANNPVSTGSFVNNTQTYYTYASPRQYSFNDVTTFPITVTVSGTFSNTCGSSTTINVNMTVVQDTADFTTAPASCGSKQIIFKDTTRNYPGDTTKQWIWDFGDGIGTSTQQNPTYTYPNKQPYTIKLRVINNIGCFYDTSKTIDLSGNVIASFTANQDTCLGGVTTFTSTSTATSGGAIQKYHWNFGEAGAADSVVTDNNNPPAPVKHRYAIAGTYKATLWVETAQGCTSAIDTVTIVIRPTPVADFIPPAGICLPGSTSFINKSDTGVSGVLTYVWNFGDNTTSVIKDPVHSYASAGTGSYAVTLVATSQYGCTSATKTTVITGIYNQPTARFTVTQSPLCSNDSIAFRDGSLSNAPAGDNSYIKQWQWFFGDNTTSTLPDPNHKYGSVNTFRVGLLAYTDKGCVSDTTFSTITTVQSPKVVFATQPGICLDASPRTITQASETTGTAGSFAYSGTGVSGNTFNPQTAGAGTFPVLATYTAGNGCKDTASSLLTVWPLPLAGFTVSNPLCQNGVVQFTDTSKTSIGKVNAWAWNLDDNTTSQIQNPTHTYPTGNTYNISLKVTTDSGCNSIIATKAIVVNPLPIPGFTIPADICLPDGTAVFTNTSYAPNDPQATLSSVWDFGDPNDPTSSTFTHGTHKYSAVNAYQVKLTVTYKGCAADTTITLPAANIHPQPKADFKADPAEVCMGKPIQFTDLSDGLTSPVQSWAWNFKDASGTSTSQNPSYTYAAAGSYMVTLTIHNQQGCISNTAIHTVIVDALPVVNGGPDQYVLQGRSVVLQPIVTGSNLSFKWAPPAYLDDPAIENPVCTPSTDQAYQLTVTAHGGCTASDSVHVWLLRQPLIPNVFSPNGDGVNDYWQIQYLSRYPGCTVQVYDRNGQLVFTSTGYQQPWDGKFKDQPLPVATYYYIIDPKNGRDRVSGSVTILR